MSGGTESPSSDENSFEDCQEAFDDDLKELTAAVGDIEVATDFSLNNLHVHFSKCLTECGEVTISDYILGYREVYKFLTLLGSVFTWVAADVLAKIEVLHKYNTGDNKHKYTTVRVMLEFEIDQKLINVKKKDDTSGSRTLLRLHRALEYVVIFLGKLQEIENTDKCAPISREAYELTLQKYHIWAIQKAAKLAMGLLPTKDGLVQKVCPEVEKDPSLRSQVEGDFIQAVESMRKVYTVAQVLYEKEELLNIP